MICFLRVKALPTQKSPYICKNLTQFFEWITIHALQIDILSKYGTPPSRKKLSPREIHNLISLCLSSTRFIFNGCHHTQKGSGNSFLELDASTHAKSHKRSKKGSIPSPLPYTTPMHNLHTSLIPSSAIFQFTQMTTVA